MGESRSIRDHRRITTYLRLGRVAKDRRIACPSKSGMLSAIDGIPATSD
jgi:hypothetical protein